ncbi:hypothetical protein [Streptomyces sp. XY332]|uniref:hypothetical protein n=1 Tax=Streptomyces sp. XY332 TaxID=1415561 RepID=UPI0006B237D8|nr:hypothetical protein [Streptomyces sp. XY332]
MPHGAAPLASVPSALLLPQGFGMPAPMDGSRASWRSTTHDRAGSVDAGHAGHRAHIRENQALFAPAALPT